MHVFAGSDVRCVCFHHAHGRQLDKENRKREGNANLGCKLLILNSNDTETRS